MSEVDVRKLRDGSASRIPPGIQRFHRYAGIPGACPHPTVVLEVIPDHVMNAFLDVMNASDAEAREDIRRNYMTLLADAVMNQNPVPMRKKGPNVKYAGEDGRDC